jgi:hypothetical protein
MDQTGISAIIKRMKQSPKERAYLALIIQPRKNAKLNPSLNLTL